jgi:hypothetical protein
MSQPPVSFRLRSCTGPHTAGMKLADATTWKLLLQLVASVLAVCVLLLAATAACC